MLKVRIQRTVEWRQRRSLRENIDPQLISAYSLREKKQRTNETMKQLWRHFDWLNWVFDWYRVFDHDSAMPWAKWTRWIYFFIYFNTCTMNVERWTMTNMPCNVPTIFFLVVWTSCVNFSFICSFLMFGISINEKCARRGHGPQNCFISLKFLLREMREMRECLYVCVRACDSFNSTLDRFFLFFLSLHILFCFPYHFQIWTCSKR